MSTCKHCGEPAYNNYFDRTVCPPPCDTMHTCCDACGKPLDSCAHEPQFPTLADAETWMAGSAGRWVPQGIGDLYRTAYGRLKAENEELKLQVRDLEEARATGRCGMGNRYCPGSDW